jgi:hypothetical protein
MNRHKFDPSYARAASHDRCVVCGMSAGAAVHQIDGEAQHERALRLANRARFAGAAVKRDVRAGHLDLDVALFDARADSVMIIDLLRAAPRWGAHRARDLLNDLRISEIKRCRDLTPHQRHQIAERVAPKEWRAA